MPAFQSLTSNKRKHEEEELSTSNKRVSSLASLGQEGEVWMVQWCSSSDVRVTIY